MKNTEELAQVLCAEDGLLDVLSEDERVSKSDRDFCLAYRKQLTEGFTLIGQDENLLRILTGFIRFAVRG